eukprot:1292625-Prymnesium_polylepis.1
MFFEIAVRNGNAVSAAPEVARAQNSTCVNGRIHRSFIPTHDGLCVSACVSILRDTPAYVPSKPSDFITRTRTRRNQPDNPAARQPPGAAAGGRASPGVASAAPPCDR